MSFSEKNIKKECTTAAFKKGQNLFQKRQVYDCSFERDESAGVIYIDGKVKGNNKPFYSVSIQLDEKREYQFMTTSCKCEAYRNIPGLCKHLVALAFSYVAYEEDHSISVEGQSRQKLDQNIFEKNAFPVKQEGEHTAKKGKVITSVDEFLEQMDRLMNRQEPQSQVKSREEANRKMTAEEKLREALGLGSIKKGMDYPKAKTDRTITKIINEITGNKWTVESPMEMAEIELEPVLSIPYGSASPEISIRVGTKQKYVVKSLEDFCEHVEKGDYFQYGQRLGFIHERGQFKESSLPLLDFIMDYMHIKSRETKRSFYHTPATKNIVLDDVLFEKFIFAVEQGSKEQLSMDGSIELWGGRHIFYTLKKGNPHIEVKFSKADEGAYLDFPDFRCFIGKKTIFFLKDNEIYHCSDNFSKDMRVILEHLSFGGERQLFVAKEDIQEVCAHIVPLLDKYFTIKEKDISIEEYQPPEVEFYLYMDDRKDYGVICRLECVYGEERYRIFQETPPNVYRDRRKEGEMIGTVCKYFQVAKRKNSDFAILEEENLYALLMDGISELNQMGQVFATDAFLKNEIKQTPTVDLGVSIKSGLLDISIQADQLPYEELDEILNSYKMRKRYHRLRDGSFMELEDSSLSVLSELADGLQMKGKDFVGGKLTMPKHRAMYVDAVLKDAGEQVHVHRDNLFKGLIRNIKNVEDSDYEVPKEQEMVLRSYQRKGYRWLRTIQESGFGGILADDMGLGKTLQVITLFQACKEAVENFSALVVCPSSLVYNWKNELQKFAPNLQVLVVVGSADSRRSMIEKETGADIWITSYDTLKRDVQLYENQHFSVQIIDEAQYIKNASTKVAKAVKNISSTTRFALTGTPIENRLSELWSIFDYLMPGLLFSYKKFKEELESHIVSNLNDEEQVESKEATRLRNMVRPFILRRLKKDVLKDLPKKLENVVYGNMEGKQMKLYQAHLQRLKKQILGQSDKEYKANKIQILAELTRLRQLCCDPSLCYEDYDGNSAKMDVCLELLDEVINGGHKVLLFSQFTTMLDRIAEKLKEKGIAYYMLTGETKKEKRVEMASEFNEDKVPVFLISLRAGGTGLNLVGADMVIHFDPWWNLSAQNQATDRAHRIGQKNVVTVFKLIMADSIEEKILALQEKKKNLADQIISQEGFAEGSLTREDLLGILEN